MTEMIYIVMRKPCLMEDEGRTFTIGFYQTRAEAAAWINAQKGEYFDPGSYYIAEVKAGE
jgi:hypothetical protein